MKVKSLARSEGLCGRNLNSNDAKEIVLYCCHLCHSQASAMD